MYRECGQTPGAKNALIQIISFMKRSLFETNKRFPSRYRELILDVLEQYPDLQHTHIRFVLRKKYPVPYGTRPTLSSVFQKPENRVYIVSLREKAEPPTESVLFHNLTDTMRRGVIAHELMHIVQYQAESRKGLLKLLLNQVRGKKHRQLERNADKGAIERGYGEGLYAHAVYIRQVPGYVEQRPQLNRDYLLPDEIRAYMDSLQDAS